MFRITRRYTSGEDKGLYVTEDYWQPMEPGFEVTVGKSYVVVSCFEIKPEDRPWTDDQWLNATRQQRGTSA